MMLKKTIQFITTDIWRLRLGTYSRLKAWPVKNLRVLILALRGYHEDKCQFRASALTFYTLLSIVPVLAMMFGVAKGFGMEERVQEVLMEKMQGQEQVVEKIITFSNALLEKTRGDVIAGIGIALLFMTVIRVLGNIENSFNFIWGIKKDRSLGRKFSDYLAVVIICPILLVLSSSSTVYISSQIQTITANVELFSGFQKFIFQLLRILPYCSLWIVFSFIFIFMPNTKVKLKSGILAGVIAGTIFQIVQILYIKSQMGVTRANAIYGSFAALPFFLIWLQLSWFIVLFGAEFSFAHQNVETYELEPDCLGASYDTKKKISLFITSMLVKNFCTNQKPVTANQISHDHDIPIRLVRDILYELTAANVVSQVNVDDSKDFAYQPARDVEQLTVSNVIEAIEKSGKPELPVKRSPELDKLEKSLDEMHKNAQISPANILLKDL